MTGQCLSVKRSASGARRLRRWGPPFSIPKNRGTRSDTILQLLAHGSSLINRGLACLGWISNEEKPMKTVIRIVLLVETTARLLAAPADSAAAKSIPLRSAEAYEISL